MISSGLTLWICAFFIDILIVLLLCFVIFAIAHICMEVDNVFNTLEFLRSEQCPYLHDLNLGLDVSTFVESCFTRKLFPNLR